MSPSSPRSTPPLARRRPTPRERQKRASHQRARKLSAVRRRRAAVWATGLLVLLAGVIGLVATRGTASSSPAVLGHHDQASSPLGGPAGPERIPLERGPSLAPATTTAGGEPVDGVACQPTEQVVYHVHTHLSVFVDGILRPIPPGIGIVLPVPEQTVDGAFYAATTCYYWLHVHAQDGVIHIESPSMTAYTLGQFFAIWGQPLSATQVGPATGRLTVFVDGRLHRGDPAGIGLGSHEDIQVDVGKPVVPPERVNWTHTGL